MAISAVADPPVAIRIRFSAMTLLRSLHRTSIFVAYASPFPSSIRPSSRPKVDCVGGERSLIWSAVAILEQMQTGRPALIKKDGGEMLIAIVLDLPLAEAQALVNTPDAFLQALTTIIQDKKNHPVIAQMIQPDTGDDAAPAEATASSSRSYTQRAAKARPPHIRIPIPIRTRGREVLTVATHRYLGRSYLAPCQRSHWSPWGTHGWPAHL